MTFIETDGLELTLELPLDQNPFPSPEKIKAVTDRVRNIQPPFDWQMYQDLCTLLDTCVAFQEENNELFAYINRGLPQSIATAPRDGVYVLLWDNGNGWEVGCWDALTNIGWKTSDGRPLNPTHWAYVPEPPSQQEEHK